jgi:hypothetical protein
VESRVSDHKPVFQSKLCNASKGLILAIAQQFCTQPYCIQNDLRGFGASLIVVFNLCLIRGQGQEPAHDLINSLEIKKAFYLGRL